MEILGRWLAVIVLAIALGAFLLALLRAKEPFADAFETAVAMSGARRGRVGGGCMGWGLSFRVPAGHVQGQGAVCGRVRDGRRDHGRARGEWAGLRGLGFRLPF